MSDEKLGHSSGTGRTPPEWKLLERDRGHGHVDYAIQTEDGVMECPSLAVADRILKYREAAPVTGRTEQAPMKRMVWTPVVEEIRKALMEKFSDRFTMDAIANAAYDLGGVETEAASEPPTQPATTFTGFSAMNRTRCEAPDGFNHPLSGWTTSDWFTAIMGELGEAANVAKKLNRVRDGIPGNKEKTDALKVKLRQELGDTFVYLDLLAQSLGFNIGAAAQEVFDEKSKEIGYVAAAAPTGQWVRLVRDLRSLAYGPYLETESAGERDRQESEWLAVVKLRLNAPPVD